MSVLEEALIKAKEFRTRLIETIDAFRPKILVKKPLREIKLLGGEEVGEGLGTIVERIRARIEKLRELTVGSETETGEGKEIESKIINKEKKGIHY